MATLVVEVRRSQEIVGSDREFDEREEQKCCKCMSDGGLDAPRPSHSGHTVMDRSTQTHYRPETIVVH